VTQGGLGPVKRVVKTAVASRPGWRMARRMRRPGCVVLLYHRIGIEADPLPHLDARSFAAQMAWLATHCHVIEPEALQERAARDTRSGRPSVLVTFDDGYSNYFELAYPVLRSHRIRALNFLSTRYVDEPMLVEWWDRLFLAVRATTRTVADVPWLGGTMPLDEAGRARLLRMAKDFIKRRPNDERDGLMASLLDALGVDEGSIGGPRQTMTWDEVRAASEVTCFGGHTHTHAIVSQLDPLQLETEIRTCRDRLLSETGAAPEMFAYPNGEPDDFSDQAKAVLLRYGFRIAFSAIPGLNGRDTDWMEVRRIAGGQSVEDLAWRMSLLWR
jgi:peptidoglycan/xylan/chitin deacetylase (PgdA/CDA1 family)